jgi:hypothetical protein
MVAMVALNMLLNIALVIANSRNLKRRKWATMLFEVATVRAMETSPFSARPLSDPLQPYLRSLADTHLHKARLGRTPSYDWRRAG